MGRGRKKNSASLQARPHRRGTASSLLFLLTPAAVSLLLTGCANPGPPKPPSLHLPKLAEHLAAVRVGNHVQLTWTTSTETTDGDTLRGPITAVLCRDDSPKPPPPAPIYPTPPDPCKPVAQFAVTPGNGSAVDELPAPLATGPVALVAYRVTLLNSHGRTAGPSNPVYTAIGNAPEPAGPLRFTPARNGVLIQWQRAASPANPPMQLTRNLIATAAGPVADPPRKQGAKPAGASLQSEKSATPRQVTLGTTTNPTQPAPDPGGIVDRGIHDGDTVTYTAQRVLSVSLDVPATVVTGKQGEPEKIAGSTQTFEIRGEPSPVATFIFHDTLPPSAPTGLAAIPGGGFGQPPSIDLSWEPNPELDVIGYNVYRALGDGSWTRITAEPVPGLGYRDLTARPSVAYRYRISAVDRHRNESAHSAPIASQLQP